MVGSDSILELRNICHSGQVEPSSWTQRLFGSVESGLILKDISLEIKPGEVFAVLGSKGSGKRALLDVISRRAQGATRGQILFESRPLTLSLFQRSCGYVTNRTDLIPSLTTEQTLYYTANLSSGEKVCRYTCSTRVRQMLGDLALNQVGQHSVATLGESQTRRLIIGCQLMRDPTLLLLDEPTADLDPLSTYLIVSILSSYARRRGRGVILTMEKPRSDVFPFLDRAAFLCLGDILYTGPTRLMFDYFNSIGFPCPTTENPLMYYLCLSTVDRRSRERFLESHTQILELVDKFKAVGSSYVSHPHVQAPPLNKNHLKSANPSCIQLSTTLYQRLLASTFNITPFGLSHMFLRLTLFPIFTLLLFVIYFKGLNSEHHDINRAGLMLFSLIGTYTTSAISTAFTFGSFRTRYYQEAQEGIYSGPLFLVVYLLFSIPFSLATVAAGSRILFEITGLTAVEDWAVVGAVLWGSYLLAEQQTIAILMVVKREFNAIVISVYFCLLYLVLGSGLLRSYGGMPEWLLYTGYGTQTHYASLSLADRFFPGLPIANCSTAQLSALGCKISENHILSHRSTSPSWDPALSLGLSSAFILSTLVTYLMPLPAFVKAKFRQ